MQYLPSVIWQETQARSEYQIHYTNICITLSDTKDHNQ